LSVLSLQAETIITFANMKTKPKFRHQKPNVIKKKKREPIKEARRYVDNARDILVERGKLDDEGQFQ
jgi:hypothetical protein